MNKQYNFDLKMNVVSVLEWELYAKNLYTLFFFNLNVLNISNYYCSDTKKVFFGDVDNEKINKITDILNERKVKYSKQEENYNCFFTENIRDLYKEYNETL